MRLAFRLAMVVLAALPLSANSTLRVDFAQLSRMADRVVAGRITKITPAQDPRNGNIYSTVTIAVSQAVPAQLAGREFSFRMIGGELNGRIQYIADYPKLRLGNDVALFLQADTSGVFGPTIGLGQGVFYLESGALDTVQRVADRFGRPVLGIRDNRLIRGIRRQSDAAGAALATPGKGRPAMALGEFFDQVRSLRALPTVAGPR